MLQLHSLSIFFNLPVLHFFYVCVYVFVPMCSVAHPQNRIGRETFVSQCKCGQMKLFRAHLAHTYARHVCAVDHTRTRTNGGETATAGGADLFTNSEDPISILPPLCAFSKSCAYVHATAPQRTAPHRIVRTCVHACIQASGNVCGPFI